LLVSAELASLISPFKLAQFVLTYFAAPMKTPKNTFAALVAFVLLAASASATFAQSIAVSPAIVSNTYPGLITLTITGLNNGEKVGIQRWMDLNGNGVIDPGEPLMDAFTLTDNNNIGAMVGTVTNLNVPIDLNSATGAITSTLNFVPAMALENLTGHFIYQMVSTTGRFSPVSTPFMVTNTPQAQTISGTIYGPDGVTPLPNAVVVLQDQQKNDAVGGIISDANGHYSCPARTGSYFLIAALPNYYYDMSAAPSVVLTNGMNSTNNLTLTNGTTTISGKIYNAANTNGIPGLLMTLQSGGFFSVAFTDTNGNFSAAVTPSHWKIQPEKQRLVRRAFVLPEATPFQFDATGGDLTNAYIALPKATALLYGRLTDNNGNPFPNVEVDGNTMNTYDAKGYTDPNGYYSVGVLGDATNYWSAQINSAKNDAMANYVVNTGNSQTLSSFQAVLQNFVALPAIGYITGNVRDNSNNIVVGVGLNAQAYINGNYYQSLDSTTDSSGNYSLAVAAGQWQLQFFTGNSSDALDTHGLADITGPHYATVPPTNAVLNLTVYPYGTPLMTSPQRVSPTQFGFMLNGAPSVNYTVQVSTNLASTNWATVFSLQLTNSSVFVTDSNATNSPRYYRVLKN